MTYPASASARLFPDLQQYFAKYLKTNQLDRYEVAIPGSIYNDHFFNCRSFIRMLFDDDWKYPNYTYCYKDIDNWESWPISIRDRLLIYSQAKYYLPCCDATNYNLLFQQCDSTSTSFLNNIDHDETLCCDDSTSAENIFQLQHDNFVLLDALNIYRCDSTALQVLNQVNHTEPSLFQLPGSSRWLLIVDFNYLSPLSKLIFLYLNLKVNHDYRFYTWDNEEFIGSYIFENLYELYVVDNIFQYIVSIGPDYVES